MKKSKKLIAMLLTLMMLLSILPVAAFAEEKSVDVCADTVETVSVELIVDDTLSITVTTTRNISPKRDVILEKNNGTLTGAPEQVAPTKRAPATFSVTASKVGEETITIGSAVISVTVKAAEPAHTHSLTEVKTCSATCTTDGVKTAYWVCSGEGGCGKYFSDSEGENEISAETLAKDYIIPAAHTYDNPSYAWDGDSCTATLTCSVCEAGTEGKSISETKQGAFTQDTAATCTEAAKGHYEVTFDDARFGSAQTEANTASYGAVDPSNHCGEAILDETTVVASTCVAGGYSGDKICSECKAVVEEGKATDIDPDNHATEGRNPVAAQTATCQHVGWDAYEVCACGEKIGYKEYPITDHVDNNGDFICDNCTHEFLAEAKEAAIAEINKLAGNKPSEAVKAIVSKALADIESAETVEAVNAVKDQALKDVKAQQDAEKPVKKSWLETLLDMLDQYLPTVGKLTRNLINATIKAIKDTTALIHYLEKLFNIMF